MTFWAVLPVCSDLPDGAFVLEVGHYGFEEFEEKGNGSK
jgi:hypothetical protein